MRASTQHVRIVFVLFIAFGILRGYLAFASVKMPQKKRIRSCPFSSSKPRAKKKSKSEFDKEWAAKLAESDKSSVYRQEKWLEELDIQKSENATVAASASRSKIQLEEPEEESQLSSTTPSADGTWKTISGRAIVSSEKRSFRNGTSLYLVNFAREESKSWKMQRLSMDLVLPRESSARIKAVRRTRQILFLILSRRAERLK